MSQSITFKIIHPDAEPGEWGSGEDPSPYFGLSEEKMTRSVGCLQDKFDVVIDKPRIRVLFNYPLREEHIIELVPLFGAKNFTRVGLAKAISVKYQQIYAEEEKSTQLPIESIADRNQRLAGELPEDTIGQRIKKRKAEEFANTWRLMNRARTDGKWGIWGHDLSDLDLHTVTYDPDNDLYYLAIDS